MLKRSTRKVSNKVASKMHLDEGMVHDLVDHYLTTVAEELANGNEARIPYIGVFKTYKKSNKSNNGSSKGS